MKQNYPFLNIGLFFIQGYASVHVFLILAALVALHSTHQSLACWVGRFSSEARELVSMYH